MFSMVHSSWKRSPQEARSCIVGGLVILLRLRGWLGLLWINLLADFAFVLYFHDEAVHRCFGFDWH